jgi:toxin-antitoxin system PIN domain toxin
LILIDVNVLVYAFREDAPGHRGFKRWLEDVINADAGYAVSELVLGGFIRVVTHPRIFDPPAKLTDALGFCEALRSQPNCTLVGPGPRHWEIFTDLCRRVSARGNLVPDAYLAALAIETGSEWITTDGDFGRFPGLRWRQPIEPG